MIKVCDEVKIKKQNSYVGSYYTERMIRDANDEIVFTISSVNLPVCSIKNRFDFIYVVDEKDLILI